MADMTDKELIGYCDIHCETPRALFSHQHINRMIRLAGYPDDWPREIEEGPGRFSAVHEEMKELCSLALARMTRNESTTILDNVVSLTEFKVARAVSNETTQGG